MKFQYLVLIVLIIFIVLVIAQKRKRLPGKTFAVMMASIMFVFFINPDLSTKVANYFGIGLGVDFLSYISHLFSFLLLFVFYVRIKKLEAKLTKTVRAVALAEAER